MNRYSFFLFAVFLSAAFSSYSQSVTLDDFESENAGWEAVNPGWISFFVVANPQPDEVNRSANVLKVTRYAHTPDWAGIILRDKVSIPFGIIRGQYRYLHMKILKESDGNLSLKLEKNGDKGSFTETKSYTPSGEWREVVFDLLDASGSVYDDFFIMPDRTPDNQTAIVVYLDDIVFKPDPEALVVEDTELPGEFELLWSDEFDGSSYDPEIWAPQVAGDGFGNNELQYYTGNEKNIFTRDGNLVLKAFKEDYQGKNYTSGKLWSKNLKSLKYGRIEARIRLPHGRGVWPAVWMLPREEFYGGWPHSGEIDIMEFVGHDPDNLHAAVHRTVGSGNLANSTYCSMDGTGGEFQTVRIDWEPGSIKWYRNDRLFHIYNNAYTDERQWPFDREFYLILNLAVGGDWGGAEGVDDSIWPQEFLVDYIRVYQKKDNSGLTSVETAPFSVGWISRKEIKLELPYRLAGLVRIYSTSGEELLARSVVPENPVIDVSVLTPGIYLVSFSDEQGRTYSQKIKKSD